MDVEHTKALEQKATPGPWEHCTKTYDGMPLVVAEGYGFPAEPAPHLGGIIAGSEADAEFIAHARTVVPVLVAAVERVQALHTQNYGRNLATQKFETYCEHCNTAWPCPTIEALETP